MGLGEKQLPVKPCVNCRYLKESAVGRSQDLGTVKASLGQDGSISFDYSRAGGCDKVFGVFGPGTIDKHSPSTASAVRSCEGPYVSRIKEPRGRFLGLFSISKTVEITECGSMYDGDLVRIVEDAVLHPRAGGE